MFVYFSILCAIFADMFLPCRSYLLQVMNMTETHFLDDEINEQIF